MAVAPTNRRRLSHSFLRLNNLILIFLGFLTVFVVSLDRSIPFQGANVVISKLNEEIFKSYF
jgi:hypothetical protein